MSERPPPGRRPRPWSSTGGRVQPLTDDIRLDTAVISTGQPGGPVPGTRQAEVLSLCRPVRAVAELAALLDLPLGITGALVADLRDGGWVQTRQPLDATDNSNVTVALLRRLKEKLQDVNVS
ncbi:DUF742 domain-containing protein [Streptomyces niveus]|uniref:DUF742 domain-containing protein n=1 Tax=Streptomyces niveus TaxID=193462 RepID=UPI0036743455